MSDDTLRIYFNNSYLIQFTATVTTSTTYQNKPAAILDQTAFYPEGGGQPADHGTLNGIKVLDVQEKDEQIFHILEKSIDEGATVAGEIDWQRRFDHMQQHTGQHILSGAFQRLLDTETLSWHLSNDYVSIDISRTGISSEELARVEMAANQIVAEARPVTAKIYTSAELPSLNLRKSPTRDSEIRVVTIADWDAIGCGGTHVRTTAEVGHIAIRRVEAHSGTSRVQFICGLRAVTDYRKFADTVNNASAILSIKPEEVMEGITRLKSAQQSLENDLKVATKVILEYEANKLIEKAIRSDSHHPFVCEVLPERDAGQLRIIAQYLAENNIIALLGSFNTNKVNLCFAAPERCSVSMNTILQKSLSQIDGRGGGQPTLAQGGGTNISGLQTALDVARAEISSIV